jgi:hypothetical protein
MPTYLDYIDVGGPKGSEVADPAAVHTAPHGRRNEAGAGAGVYGITFKKGNQEL